VPGHQAGAQPPISAQPLSRRYPCLRTPPALPVADGLAALREAIGVLLRAGGAQAPTTSRPSPTPRPAVVLVGGGGPPDLGTPDLGTPDLGTPEQPSGEPTEEDQPGEVWQVVARAQGGDAEAFGELYDRYVDTVFRYIYFRVGTRALAEDLVSETFLRALRRIGSVTWQGRDFGAWLVTIARNLVADHYKSGRYRLEISTPDILDADRADAGREGRPEEAVLDLVASETLLTAVRQLGAEQQECIVLRFLHGLSVAETAEAMAKNTGAIKALQYRAVRSLARLLPQGFAP
jgi:RNA polymerase sigma-70 factor (ECF subfamily)